MGRHPAAWGYDDRVPAAVAQAVLTPVDPATLAPLGSVAVTEPAGLEEAVAEARLAGEAWARRPPDERPALLGRVAHELAAADAELVRTIVSETGKPLVEAYTHDLLVAAEALGWLAAKAGQVLAPERLHFRRLLLPQKRAWLRYEPAGVVAVITPWNFPIGVSLSQVATAVAAGNAVILKPSELTPHCGAWVEELFARAGAPPGLVRVVQGPGASVGDQLVGHRGIDAIVFTGSTDTGRVVARRAAERLCPVILELGGSDPMLVLHDADLERTVAGALWGSFSNCGQVCAGVERIYVARPLHDRFVSRLAEAAASLRIGQGTNARVELGPLVTEGQRRRVEELVADAIEHGATIVAGGGRPDVGLPGWFHEPTVLDGEPHAARLRREEIFGPVVTVSAFGTEDEAVRRANDSPFALGASVWSRDRSRARAIEDRLDAGSVWINDHAYSYGAMEAPWGGRRGSGTGTTHSKHGLYALSQVRFADADAGRLRNGWWYPYGDAAVDGFRGVLGAFYGSGLRSRAGAVARHHRGIAHLVRKALQ